MYNNPQVDRILGIFCGSFKDQILPTPGWLYADRVAVQELDLSYHNPETRFCTISAYDGN